MKKEYRHSMNIPASLILLFFMFIPTGKTLIAQAAPVTQSSEIGVDYLNPEASLLPLEAKQAVALALNGTQKGIESKNARFSVLSIRWETTWALLTVTDADMKSPIESDELIESLQPLVLVRDNQEWKAALKGDAIIDSLLDVIPDHELSPQAKDTLFADPGILPAQSYNDYKFPWQSGNPWVVTGPWHGSGSRALDFRPSNNVNTDVLAAAPGTITVVAQCSPSGHVIFNITTDNTNEYLGYTHLDGASFQALGLKAGDHVSQGQKLGIMAPNSFSGADSCNIVSTGMHLHILMPVKPFTMDGKTFSDGYYYSGVELYSSQGATQTTFTDVSDSYWASSYIESLYNAGVTGGCSTSPLMYCPEDAVTRAQMAVFLLRGKHGSGYVPANATGAVFSDVASSYWAASWIENLSSEGITGGCGTNIYCPDSIVSRAQMAIFLLRTKYNASYVPPPATGTFADVPTDYWAAAWIEQLAAEGVTSGCGSGNYCPDQNVTRAQMAVFLVKNFNLP